MRKIQLLLLLLLGLVSLPPRSEAILGVGDLVFDVAVEWQAAITAIQTTAMQMNQLVDMQRFGSLLIESEEYVTDIEELNNLLQEAPGLAWDLTRLMGQYERLFGFDGLPDTSDLYALRRTEVRSMVMDGHRYAMRMQTLLMRTTRVLQRLLAFVQRIGGVLGNVQVAQTVSEGLQQVNATMLQANAMRTTFERAQTTESADEVSSIESLTRINKGVWKKWPGMVP